MVRNHYMSLLSAFDDAALEKGLQEIAEHHPEERLEFPDTFAFVLGSRLTGCPNASNRFNWALKGQLGLDLRSTIISCGL
jgi:hypothetical protein